METVLFLKDAALDWTGYVAAAAAGLIDWGIGEGVEWRGVGKGNWLSRIRYDTIRYGGRLDSVGVPLAVLGYFRGGKGGMVGGLSLILRGRWGG